MNTYLAPKLAYTDMCLTCVDCEKDFDFPATEQDYFAKNELDPPKRCRDCRAKKQQLRGSTFVSRPQKGLQHRMQSALLQPTETQTPPSQPKIEQPISNFGLGVSSSNQDNAIILNEIRSLRQEVFSLRNELLEVRKDIQAILSEDGY